MAGLKDKLKNRTQYSVAVENKRLELFKELSARTRIPQSKLLDEAIADLLKKNGIEIPRE